MQFNAVVETRSILSMRVPLRKVEESLSKRKTEAMERRQMKELIRAPDIEIRKLAIRGSRGCP